MIRDWLKQIMRVRITEGADMSIGIRPWEKTVTEGQDQRMVGKIERVIEEVIKVQGLGEIQDLGVNQEEIISPEREFILSI